MIMSLDNEEISIIQVCSGCGAAITDKSLFKCTRCGVPCGDLLEKVIADLDKYEEGCEPRSLHEYDCMCGLDEFHPWKTDRNWKHGERPL